MVYFEPRRRELQTADTAPISCPADCRAPDSPPAASAARCCSRRFSLEPRQAQRFAHLDTGLREAMDGAGSAHHVRRGVPSRCGDGESFTEHPTRRAFGQRCKPRSCNRSEEPQALHGFPRPRLETNSEAPRSCQRSSPQDRGGGWPRLQAVGEMGPTCAAVGLPSETTTEPALKSDFQALDERLGDGCRYPKRLPDRSQR